MDLNSWLHDIVLFTYIPRLVANYPSQTLESRPDLTQTQALRRSTLLSIIVRVLIRPIPFCLHVFRHHFINLADSRLWSHLLVVRRPTSCLARHRTLCWTSTDSKSALDIPPENLLPMSRQTNVPRPLLWLWGRFLGTSESPFLVLIRLTSAKVKTLPEILLK